MSAATLTLWGHALAALMFAILATAQARRGAPGLPRTTFVAALGLTALWALGVAGIEHGDVSVRVMESLRNLGWLCFMFALLQRDRQEARGPAIGALYGVVATVILVNVVLAVAQAAAPEPAAAHAIGSARLLFRMMVTVSALVLVRHLYGAAAPSTRGAIRLVVLALAAMWTFDFLSLAVGWWTGSPPASLIATRGFLFVALAPVFGIAVHRTDDWTLRVSRTVALQSAWGAAAAIYVVAMVFVTGAIGAVAGAEARLAQAAFVFGGTAAMLTLVSTPWTRAWLRVKIAKHLSSHRYDYRTEWIAFTDTLGRPDANGAALDERVVKAIADLTESPAGLLLVPHGDELTFGAHWRWTGPTGTDPAADEALHLSLAGGRILELDAIRAGTTDPADAAAVAPWMLDAAEAWVLVPLLHFDRLAGAVLLARPPIDRALDWEDFDLLRIAGRQAASYLAEARTRDALAEAERFDEFNRRFAFIMHDIKNLVSQLTLVARNAERHADNPAFRADMVATLQDSAGRMNELLARLSQHHHDRAEGTGVADAAAVARSVAAARRVAHAVSVAGERVAPVRADRLLLEQLLGHLVQNAIEASPSDRPVALAVLRIDGHVAIDVVDQGCGMSPAFVREKLFKPFVSSKPGGFGIGAFEARQLAEAMGGTVTVTSREGEGTRFRVTLPAAPVLEAQEAA